VPWAVYQHSAWRHPTQIYLSLANIVILGALWLFARSRPQENGLFYVQGLLYCLARFGIEFLRDHGDAASPLSAAQWACLAGLLFFATKLCLHLKPIREAQIEMS
jgi:phosphatidylglycerol:prolipoprotein diacylglycerol transferase